MKNIKDFKKVRYYSGDRELTNEERKKIGLDGDSFWSLDERAYQSAYDISNDWAKEVPEWSDVEESFRRGVKEAFEYVIERYELNELKSLLDG